jgi:hypothetical protein
MSRIQRNSFQLVRLLIFLLAVCACMVRPALADNTQGGVQNDLKAGNQANGGDKDPNPGTAFDIRKNYFLRYPVAREFGPFTVNGHDVIQQGYSLGPGIIIHSKSGPVQVWPKYVPTATSHVPTKRDEAIMDDLFQTFGYPVSDTQFQIIQRYNDNRMLEQLYDPEKLMWLSNAVSNLQAVSTANSAAGLARNQAVTAIDNVNPDNKGYLKNFTVDQNNIWNKIRDQLFVPMAILLMLPGAVMTQVKAIVAQGTTVLGDVNPWEGILRSIVCIFLIPATYLVVNYGIDVNNSIAFTIKDEYKRIFKSDMYSDAKCSEARALPIRDSANNDNALVKDNQVPSPQQDTANSGNEALNFDVFRVGPDCKTGTNQGTDEGEKDDKAIARAVVNGVNVGLNGSFNVLTAFQTAFMLYLWCMGPIAAALWVWPMKQFRDAFGNWCAGVVTLSFWSLFWNTTVLLMACFKGVDDTGTIIMTALNWLAVASVQYAFNFEQLVSAAGQQAASKAMEAGQAAAGGGKGFSQSGGAHGVGASGGGQVGHGGAGSGAHGAAGSHGPGSTAAGGQTHAAAVTSAAHGPSHAAAAGLAGAMQHSALGAASSHSAPRGGMGPRPGEWDGGAPPSQGGPGPGSAVGVDSATHAPPPSTGPAGDHSHAVPPGVHGPSDQTHAASHGPGGPADHRAGSAPGAAGDPVHAGQQHHPGEALGAPARTNDMPETGIKPEGQVRPEGDHMVDGKGNHLVQDHAGHWYKQDPHTGQYVGDMHYNPQTGHYEQASYNPATDSHFMQQFGAAAGPPLSPDSIPGNVLAQGPPTQDQSNASSVSGTGQDQSNASPVSGTGQDPSNAGAPPTAGNMQAVGDPNMSVIPPSSMTGFDTGITPQGQLQPGPLGPDGTPAPYMVDGAGHKLVQDASGHFYAYDQKTGMGYSDAQYNSQSGHFQQVAYDPHSSAHYRQEAPPQLDMSGAHLSAPAGSGVGDPHIPSGQWVPLGNGSEVAFNQQGDGYLKAPNGEYFHYDARSGVGYSEPHGGSGHSPSVVAYNPHDGQYYSGAHLTPSHGSADPAHNVASGSNQHQAGSSDVSHSQQIASNVTHETSHTTSSSTSSVASHTDTTASTSHSVSAHDSTMARDSSSQSYASMPQNVAMSESVARSSSAYHDQPAPQMNAGSTHNQPAGETHAQHNYGQPQHQGYTSDGLTHHYGGPSHNNPGQQHDGSSAPAYGAPHQSGGSQPYQSSDAPPVQYQSPGYQQSAQHEQQHYAGAPPSSSQPYQSGDAPPVQYQSPGYQQSAQHEQQHYSSAPPSSSQPYQSGDAPPVQYQSPGYQQSAQHEQQHYSGPAQQQSYGGPPPQHYADAPPQPNYGGPPPQQHYADAPPQPNYGGPPPQQHYADAPPQPSYGSPPPQNYYADAPPQPNYGSQPSQQYSPDAQPQPNYASAPPQPHHVDAPPQAPPAQYIAYLPDGSHMRASSAWSPPVQHSHDPGQSDSHSANDPGQSHVSSESRLNQALDRALPRKMKDSLHDILGQGKKFGTRKKRPEDPPDEPIA